MPRTKIQLVLDDEEFTWLFDTFQEWASQMDGTAIAPASGFRNQISNGRFAVVGTAGELPSTAWKWGCWTDSYLSIVIARGFLDAWGIPYQAVTDEAGGWGVLTDYEWKREG